MNKDFALLFYYKDWLCATAEMKASCRGWYLNLIIHQFDKSDLPDDIIELANLAGVKIDEFDEFKQVFEHVLKQKFKQNENGRLENDFAKTILIKREQFKKQRSNSGKLSYILKIFRHKYKINKNLEEFIKDNINLDIDIKNEHVLEHEFEQISELYKDKDKDIIINEYEVKNISGIFKFLNIDLPFQNKNFIDSWTEWINYKIKRDDKKYVGAGINQTFIKIKKLSNNNEQVAIDIITQSISNNWAGLFELKAIPESEKNSNKIKFPR
jgi:hypothetical protein